MPNYRFKKCELSDLAKLRKISIETFTATYEAKNTKENFEKHINHTFNTSQLTRELLDSNTVFYLLLSGKDLMGYLKLNEKSAQTEKMQDHCYELERIYLKEEFQGKGFGETLIKKSIEVAQAKNKKELWLGVWKKNPAAIDFYKKMGFEQFGTHPFLLGDEEQEDIMMKIKIE